MPENVVQNIKNISLSAFSCQPDTSKALHWCLLRIIPLALLADVGILFNKKKEIISFRNPRISIAVRGSGPNFGLSLFAGARF